jgi:hypothetical protein
MTGQLKQPNKNLIGWIIALILLLILMVSCSPEYYCKRCPVITKDSIYVSDSVVIRDTIIKIEEKTVTIRDTVPCDDFELNKDSNGVKVKVIVKNKIIYVKATCAALELKLQLYNKVKTISKTKELTRLVSEKKKCNFWLPFILGCIAASILWDLKRILGVILKVVKPI